MKKILITGINSYVGNSLAEWLAQYPNDYEVHKISVRGDDWKKRDFSIYDSIVHVAGIAHQKETKRNAQEYYRVNRDLAIDIAKKAKDENVNQFIFLSTMSVYGLETGIITEDTPLKPKTHYGKSKLQAEQYIKSIESEKFKVAIVRPPMIYGRNCPGNYQRLRKLALKTPLFPNIENKRSMIYIDNLSEFLRCLVDKEIEGLLSPQNKEYVCTSNLVLKIAKYNKKRIYLTKLFNQLLKCKLSSVIQKVFGNLLYKKNISDMECLYNIYSFDESIKLTEVDNWDRLNKE